jgi:rhodanese-related sulfurtransferase
MRSVILFSLLFLVGFAGCLRATDTSVVAPAEAAKRVADGTAVLIDVREPAEWAETGVAAPAALLPLSDLNGDRKQWTEFLEKNRAKELILYCRSGHRAGRLPVAEAAGVNPTNRRGKLPVMATTKNHRNITGSISPEHAVQLDRKHQIKAS